MSLIYANIFLKIREEFSPEFQTNFLSGIRRFSVFSWKIMDLVHAKSSPTTQKASGINSKIEQYLIEVRKWWRL